MSDDYKDAITTHNLPGTSIPAAKNASVGHGGYTFDINGVIPFNVIIDDPIKGTTVIPMDRAAIDRMQKANRIRPGEKNQKFMSYEEASAPGTKPITKFIRPEITVQPEIQEKPPVADLTPITQTEEPEQPSPEPYDFKEEEPERRLWQTKAQKELFGGMKEELVARDDFMRKELKIDASEPAKVKVKLSGSFGSLTVPYNNVYRHDIYLVLFQYSSDEAFYEAPSGTDLIKVTWNGTTYNCYPGPQFPLGEGSKVMVTLFLIDKGEE